MHSTTTTSPPRSLRRRRRSQRLLGLAALVGVLAPTLPATAEETPDPIDPSTGEMHLLDLVDGLPIGEIENALDNFPIPYVVIASAGGAPPTIQNQKAGKPVRIDADQSKATGQGGKDIVVEVNTELDPLPHLQLDIERLGGAPYAQDVDVVVAFPFSAFNDEGLPAAPNLFLGYSTTAPFNGFGYPDGGRAPESVQIDLTPGVLAGTDHLVTMDVTTTGDTNPIRFVGGHFDGDPGAAPVNAMAFSALADPVPDQFSLGVDVALSPIVLGGATSSNVTIDWQATETSKVTIDYLENEDYPFDTPDYGTTLIVDEMPMSETVELSADLVAGTVGVSHRGSTPIDELTLHHTREDGFAVRAFATDVPTEVDVVVGTGGNATLDVNAPTLDLTIAAMQDDGFAGTDGFFGYDVGYVELGVENTPDLTASWDPATASFVAQTTEPGATVDLIEMVIDDDARMFPNGIAVGRHMPNNWTWQQPRHIVSLFDDGTHGTAAARAVDASQVELQVQPSPLATHTALTTGSANPLHANVETTADSAIVPHDADVRCDVEDVPAGIATLDLGFPPPTIDIEYTSEPAATIDAVSCEGSVGTLNFEVAVEDLPAEFAMEFDPDSSLAVTAGNGVDPAPSAFVGRALVHLWDEEDPAGLPGTSDLVGVPLRDAIAQVDDAPSFAANWSDGASGTSVEFDTIAAAGPFQYLGGAQVQVSTAVDLVSPLAEPADDAAHYLELVDEGTDVPKRVRAGVFGIDAVSMATADADGDRSIEAHYAADAVRPLTVSVESAFGGRFFPDYEIDAFLIVEDVPQTWDFFTDLTTTIQAEASSPVERIAFEGTLTEAREQPEPAEGEEPPAPVFDTTNVFAQLEGIPTSVDHLVDLTPEGQAYLHLDDSINLMSFELWAESSDGSDATILGTEYGHLRVIAEDVPAGYDLDWGVAGGLHGSLTTSEPLGPIQLVVSQHPRPYTTATRELYQQPHGEVEYTEFTREIDRRYWRQGPGDDAAREAIFMGRLDGLYGASAQLDTDEDHVILLQDGAGELDFLSVRGTGFQSFSAEVTDVATAELSIPFDGDHPFFVALRNQDGDNTIVQIPNIPDTTTLEVGLDHAHLDFDSEPGDVLIYQGPLETADVHDEVTKVLLSNTPTSVHANWTLAEDGSLDVDTSNPVSIQVLSQAADQRKIFDIGVEDVSLSWGIVEGAVDEKCQLDPPGCGLYVLISQVGFDVQANPGMSGMIAVYDKTAGPLPLNSDSPPKDFVEYVPRLTVLVDDFEQFGGSVEAEVCFFGICPLGIPTFGSTVDTDLFGSMMIDFWDRGHGPADILGEPDYVHGNPWHMWPIGHEAHEHILPTHMFSPA